MFFTIAYADTHTRQFHNPLGAASSIPELLLAIVNVLLIVAVPIIVFFVIYAGFSYVMAQGNPEKIKTATQSLLYAVIGAVIVFGAYAIIAIVQSLVDAF